MRGADIGTSTRNHLARLKYWKIEIDNQKNFDEIGLKPAPEPELFQKLKLIFIKK